MVANNDDRWRALRHGSIWWANLRPPAGRRPILILTRDAVLGRMGSVTIATVTRTGRHLPTEVYLSKSDGVPTPCFVTLDNIETIKLSRLDRVITQLSQQKMEKVYDAICTALQIPR